jgi:GT2 family glycosyltransferase
VVTLDGRPVRRLALPDPGAISGPGFLRSTVVAAADEPLRRAALIRSLRQRLGAQDERPAHRSVSVVVCTHRRRDHLENFLRAAAALEPAPDELVVVDNAPLPGESCEDLVRAAGGVYVREDRKGLNNARTAGVRAASGELVAFTDDDCIPPPAWLAPLDELFDDPNTAVVTGPGFPVSLGTASQARFEEVASFVRTLEQRIFDFMAISPADANHTGAGANMTFRRSLLLDLGDPFPAELDAGTRTESGGDLYALYRVLAAGRRIVYDPRVFTYHDHRADPGALHRAVYGYGVGLSAAATKLLVEERELAALRIWRWLLSQYLEAVVRGLTGTFDPVRVRVAWDYLRGGMAGPFALARARREQGPGEPLEVETPVHEEAPARAGAAGPPEVSAIVITHRRAAMAAQCLRALARQRAGGPAFEVVLVDDSPGGLDIAIPDGLSVRRVRTRGAGAASARNAGVDAAAGGILLFLDDDLIAAPDLVERHHAIQRDGGSSIVVGYSRPRPTLETQAALSASIWWEDHFRAKRDALAPAFVDVLSGNMSVRREELERIGGFDARFGTWRREDWDWGLRALGAGAALRYAPEAVADHRFELTTRGRIAAARAEGRGDALLLERYPGALPSLHAGRTRPLRGARARLFHELFRYERPRALATLWLDLLEALRSRRTWARWWNMVQAGAYEQGFAEGSGSRARAARGVSVVPVELGGSEPLAPPRRAVPVLDMRVAGRSAATVIPADGHWNGSLAERAANTVPRWALEREESLAPADDESSARVPGLEVLELAGEDTAAWQRLEQSLRSSSAQAVLVALPGTRPGDRWLRSAADPLDAERVAAVFGRVRPDGARTPAALWTRATARSPYSAVSRPPSYVVLRLAPWLAAGGFGERAVRIGGLAPLVDSVERLLDAGLLCAEVDVQGEAPPGSERRRVEAQAALIAALADDRGWAWTIRHAAAPAVLRVGTRWRQGRRKQALGSAAALVSGAARGRRAARREAAAG